ncbi:MAG: condensation domain-containing protein, partial [Prevotellaceae bacterium]|nr:condensation domain-containing protein [Prevotellaceae bacterium]
MKALTNNLFPLTQSQMGIYFECVKREGEIVYNTPIFYRLAGRLDLNRLASAIGTAVAAHPLLFARITTDDDGMPMMQFCEEYSKMPACSVEKVSEAELEVLKPTLIQPYLLSQDRLFRIRLFETEENQYMFMEFHHVIFDGTSRHALLADINKAYLGENVQMEAFTGFDVALKEQDNRKSEAYLKAKEWSLQTFGEVEETSVPVETKTKTNTKTETEVSFGKQGIVLDITYDELKQACKEFGIGPSILTNAAYGRLLSAYTNKRSAAFSTIYNGRKDENTARTVCFMVKTLPVYYVMKDNMTVRQYVDAANTQMANAKANDIYAFSELAAQTSLNDDVMFAFQGRIFNIPAVDNVEFERLPLDFNSTSSALNLQLSVMPDGRLFLDLQYQSNRYSEDFIQRFADSYETVLREFMKNPDALVYQTSIMSEKQAAEVERMRQTCMDPAAIRFNFFHESIEYWAKQTPDAVAVIACNETLTYRELNNRANALAAILIEKGVVAGDRVCLLLPRRSWYLIAMFGVMKAGAAYIPCDPEYPSERIKLITEDSHARFVITTKDKMQPFGERALDVEELLNENENENEPTPQPLPKGKGLKSLPSGGDLEEAP